MKAFAKIYHFYNNLLSEIMRVLVFIFLLVLSILGYAYNIYPNIFITLFGLFIIWEVFYLYKISRYTPKVVVSDNPSDILGSFSIQALSYLESNKEATNIISHLVNLPQIQFIVSKLNASVKELPQTDINKDELAQTAFDLAKSLNARHVTTIDLFGAYLLSAEADSKFLFSKKLKENDLKNVLLWASTVFSKEEAGIEPHVSFAGEGFAEDWVYGWTLETKKYAVDLTGQYINEGEPVVRLNEYNQLIEALHKGSSVVLVGEVGSGKDSIVRYFAYESYMGRLSGSLYHQRVYRLMADALLAGANDQGELEQRLNLTMQELSHSGNIIIYIPEFQDLLGSKSFNLDLSGAILPYLQNKNIRIIASVTPSSYKKFVESNKSLLDALNIVSFSEISNEEMLDILFSKSLEIERKNKLSFSYRAVIAAASYAKNYSKERVEPGSAVVLLEDTANAAHMSGKKIVEEEDVLSQVKKKVHVEVGEPKEVEKSLLLSLETEIHKRIVAQKEAVSAISEAIRRLRAGLSNPSKPISFLFLGPTGVGKTETAKALADVYYGSAERFLRFDMSEFSGSEGIKRFLGAPPGEGDEKGQLTEAVYDNPYSLLLLDEFEKADQNILNLFLQVLDDGRLTDNKGKTVSFVNSIIIATSNAASEFIREEVAKGAVVDKNFKQKLIEFLETNGIFKPELLNRFDDIIVFKPLGQTEILQIAKLLLTNVTKNLKEKDITVMFEEPVIAKIASEGFDRDFGARPLRRYIQDNIEDLIAQKLLKDEIKRGDKIIASVNSQNQILLTNSNSYNGSQVSP
jgi:ATP-dependent Clp protease ATP-binding subunit ClpC